MLLFQKGTKLSFFVIMILVFGLTHCQTPPTEPVPCTNENRGHCECGNVSQGFHTYTFWIGEMQRCFTVFHPISRDSDGSEPKLGLGSDRGSGFLVGSRLDFLGRAQARARLGLGGKSSSSLEELFIIIIYCTKVYFSGKIN